MKIVKIVNFLLTLSLVIGTVSCVATDDITITIPVPKDSPLANPLVSLSPSTGFNWDMYNNQNATIVIADRYDSQYDYILQIFDEQPISGVSPIGVGTARGNSPLTIPLDINQRGTLLYVRQIDPAGRVETFSFEKPVTDSFSLRLFSNKSGETLIESVMTDEQKAVLEEENKEYAALIASEQGTTDESSAESSATTRGGKKSSVSFKSPSIPNNLIKASTYPSNAKVNFPSSGRSSWDYTGDYVIKEGDTKQLYNHFLYASRNHANIYVAGTLGIPYSLSLNGVSIYVLPTGKLIGRDLNLQQSSKLYIAEGGVADLYNVIKSQNTQVVIDGTLEANEIIGNNSNSLLYVGASGRANVAKEIRGYFSYLYIDGNQTDGSGGKLSCKSLNLYSNRTNFVIKNHAQLLVSEMIYNRSPLYNEGLVSAKDYDGGLIGEIYNTCTMTVSDQLSGVYKLFMKDASLIGKQDKVTNELKPISLATLYHSHFYLYDGSYVYINKLVQEKLSVQGIKTDNTKEASLLRLNQCRYEKAKSSVKEAVKLWIGKQYQGSFKASKGASIFNNAVDVPYDLGNCSGSVVETIPVEPDEPELINGELKGHYTVNFEDKWPQYGDCDLNDLVYHVGAVKTVQTPDGIINELTVNMQLLAVGATYHLGFGLQMSSLKGSDIQDITVSSLGQVGAKADELGAMELDGAKEIEKAGATDPVVIPLFYDAHAFLTGVASNSSNPRTMLGTGSNRITPRDITLHITFSASAQIDASKLALSDFDFFLYRPGDGYAADGRVEVHLRGYLPTKNASQAYFGTSNDASVLASGQTYRSNDNFPWAIRVMDNTEKITVNEEVTAVQVPWNWVIEGKSIMVAYPEFGTWVNSGSDSDTGWSSAE